MRFSEPPKIKDVSVHPYFEIKFKIFFIENHSFIPKDWVGWYFKNNSRHLSLRAWKKFHSWSKSIPWPTAQSVFIRLRIGYNFIHLKLLLLRILFFRDNLTSVDGHVGLHNRPPLLEGSISVALLPFKDGLGLRDTFSVNVWRMLMFPLHGSTSTVSNLFGESPSFIFYEAICKRKAV